MTNTTRCARCGKDPVEGFAELNGERYCHGDTVGPTCYMEAQADHARTRIEGRWLRAVYKAKDGKVR